MSTANGVACPRCGRSQEHDTCASCGDPICADRESCCRCGYGAVFGVSLFLAIALVALSQFFK